MCTGVSLFPLCQLVLSSQGPAAGIAQTPTAGCDALGGAVVVAKGDFQLLMIVERCHAPTDVTIAQRVCACNVVHHAWIQGHVILACACQHCFVGVFALLVHAQECLLVAASTHPMDHALSACSVASADVCSLPWSQKSTEQEHPFTILLGPAHRPL